ncbi:MAG TPA: GNAT family N-acetyltransferase [Patescibacteria group bacterium]|nr:GNAT family N-acetyltransferase [Patescibacteria group bacterium]
MEFVPFDAGVYMGAFVSLNVEYMTWIMGQLEENYGVDSFSVLGQTVPEWVDENLEPFISLRPSEWVLFILEVEGEAAGMGAVKRLREGVGEVKRVFVHPRFRGRGYGRRMLDEVLAAGRELGCSSFLLDTPRWAEAAQHIYRSLGS